MVSARKAGGRTVDAGGPQLPSRRELNSCGFVSKVQSLFTAYGLCNLLRIAKSDRSVPKLYSKL